MADLKGTLNAVAEKLFGEGTVTRFRPHQGRGMVSMARTCMGEV